MRKEFLELRQDPRLFGLVVIAPILQLTLLGYAATTDVRNVPMVVVDQDRSTESRDAGEPFRRVAEFHGGRGAVVADRGGSLPGWGSCLDGAGHPGRLRRARPQRTALDDPGRGRRLRCQLDERRSRLRGLARRVLLARAVRGCGPRPAAPLVSAQIRVWFNPQLESRHFMIPGILALVLLVVTTNLSSMAIVRERELGTLEQLNVTPIARWQLIAGKLLPYALLGMIDVALVLAVAIGWFEVPLRGSLRAALGDVPRLPADHARPRSVRLDDLGTQQQAMMTSAFFFLMPMVFLSGFVFPIENMPPAIQPVTYLIPLRYFLEILRGIFLKGVGLEVLWKDALALFAWGVAILTLATFRSRKRLA